MKVSMLLAKNVLAPLGLTATTSAIDGSIQKKIHGSGATTLIIANEDLNDIMKIIEALENSGILLTIKNEAKEQKGGFLSMLLGTLGVSLLGNLLSVGKGIVRAGEGIKKKSKKSLMPPHPLTSFEISEYYEKELRFNGVFSRDNLPKTIKNGAYVINLDEYADVGSHWIASYIKNDEIIDCDSFGVEHIPKEIMKFIGNKKDIKTNIFRLQAYDSIMCGYFCIEFIDFMLDGKSLVDFTNLFSPHDFKKNDKIITRLFKK